MTKETFRCGLCKLSLKNGRKYENHVRYCPFHKEAERSLCDNLTKLSTELRYQILNWLHPEVFDYMSFCKLIHTDAMIPTWIQVKKRLMLQRCQVCKFFYCYSYEAFLERTQNHALCVNCVYMWLTCSNYLKNNETSICYMTGRIVEIIPQLREFQLINTRALQSYNQFIDIDISYLPFFPNLSSYLDYLHSQTMRLLNRLEEWRCIATEPHFYRID